MKAPTPDTLTIPCRGCSRMVVVPRGKVVAAMRAGRNYMMFCSRKCNLATVAREGVRLQERAINAGRSYGGSSAGERVEERGEQGDLPE